MLTAIASAPSRSHGRKYNLYRCQCGNEKVILAIDVERGKTRSCGCQRGKRPVEIEDAPLTPVAVLPASKWMHDAALINALVALLRPPFGRLPYLAPTRVADICAALGCEPHHVLRAPLNIALEWDCEGERVHGRAIAAGDVFGAADVAGMREAA